ncbi:MAG TPA: FAD-dependent oxidoreductase [Planctomycetia bacterium]|nr:FAD-dependent oxidoreductase [Planctomycetia bacterium]
MASGGFTIGLGLLLALPPAPPAHDAVIYGATSAGVAAALQARRMGKSAIIIEPGRHVGGLTSGGLGWTDSGDKAVVGGIAREFYRLVKKHYDRSDSWTRENPGDYRFYRKDDDAMWTFEPKVAEKILREMLAEAKVTVEFGRRLDRAPGRGVVREGKRIAAIRMESGETYAGRMFIDATYEGDLMAAAGVSYAVGREANSQYGETLNGVARKWNKHNHRFIRDVDAYVIPGMRSSGLLPGIEAELPPEGAGDHRLQAYCYRMCMSNHPDNLTPWPKPADYDERRYELLFRNFEAGDLRIPMKPDMMPNRKTDTNNNCAFSIDYIGGNYRYPEASYAEREKILADHASYQQGLMWTFAHHPRVPAKVRAEFSKWGLAKDEFTDSGNWPHQIYVREARRMIGEYVQTEADCRRTRATPKSVGMGSYNMDSHNCARYATTAGKVQNEGDVQESPRGPYRISYGALVPKEAECENLLVPICLSSTHIAYGSIRMEPVFFVLGQSAATAAAMAIDAGIPVQKVDYAALRKRLLEDGQVLEKAAPPAPASADPSSLAGIVIDDEQAELKGFAAHSAAMGPFVGSGYRHDNATDRGAQSATYAPELPADGEYEVKISYSPASNRATAAPVTIRHAGGETTVKVNQKKAPGKDGFVSLGKFRFAKGKGAAVTIANAGADGHVIADAVQWLPAK